MADTTPEGLSDYDIKQLRTSDMIPRDEEANGQLKKSYTQRNL